MLLGVLWIDEPWAEVDYDDLTTDTGVALAVFDAPVEADGGPQLGEVEREEPEPAAHVEHVPGRREVLADLVQESLPEDQEPHARVGADHPVVVGGHDPGDRVAAHASPVRPRARAPVRAAARRPCRWNLGRPRWR